MALNYYKNELKENAQLLASKGKGILAVDESTKTVGKRLAGIGVENTEDNRRAYRGMIFYYRKSWQIYKWSNPLRRNSLSESQRWRVNG